MPFGVQIVWHELRDHTNVIDLSKGGLMAVLLHNGNKFPSVPLAHGVYIKEMYEKLQVLLQKICCEEYVC
jgi:hypothetical protein